MATVQMNVRLPRSLKEAGDAALSSVGISASEAVRALWARAADRGRGLEQVVELLRGPAREAAPDDALERAVAIVPNGLAELGVRCDVKKGFEDEPAYEEVREAALLGRLEERGLA